MKLYSTTPSVRRSDILRDAGGGVTVSDTEPPAMPEGALWYDTSSDSALSTGDGAYVTRRELAEAVEALTARVDAHHPDMFTLRLDPDLVRTSPRDCLTYSGACAEWTPVDNTGADTVRSAPVGSWTTDNPFLEGCAYVVLDRDGEEVAELDPSDLTRTVDGADASSLIRTMDVVFRVPLRYVLRGEGGITHYSEPFNGAQCAAHTVGGRRYDTLYYGVYPASVDGDGVLRSVSGAVPARSRTRAEFRAMARAKDASEGGDGLWMLWNLHQYSLIRDFALFALKNLDVQAQLGLGFASGGNATNYASHLTGTTDRLGMFAGCTTDGTAPNDVRCFLESLWSNGWENVDDTDVNPGFMRGSTAVVEIWAGTNHPDDVVCESTPEENNANKTLVAEFHPTTLSTSASVLYGSTMNLTQYGWGLPMDGGGSSSTGVCDASWVRGGERTARVPLVTGHCNAGSDYGVASWNIARAVDYSGWDTGARLVYLR